MNSHKTQTIILPFSMKGSILETRQHQFYKKWLYWYTKVLVTFTLKYIYRLEIGFVYKIISGEIRYN